MQLRATDPAVTELVHLSTVYGPDADMYPVEAANDPFATRIDQLSHGPWPDEFDVYFGFFCGPESDRIGYQVRVRLQTSLPADSGDVPYDIILNPGADPDAGGDN